MIALSYISNIAPVLAQPRLFIGPEIPGYLSDQGTVLLPMTLDGRMTDTRVSEGDPKFLEFFSDHRTQFVCRSPQFVIYNNKRDYEESVHPPWLGCVRDWVDDDWECYAAVFPEHVLQRAVLNRVKEGFQALVPIFSGCLYIGSYGLLPTQHFLHAHDLVLYGREVDLDEGPLYPVLRLLETFYHTYEQLRAGTHEKIVVHQPKGRSTVHDVDYLAKTHESSMQFAQVQGSVLSLPREDIRPNVGAAAGPNGNINPVELQDSAVHPCFLDLQQEIFRRSSVFLGFLLILHYQLDGSLIEALTKRLKNVAKADPFPAEEHLQFVLEAEMYDLGHNLSRDDYGFEGRCLLRAIQALQTIQ